MRRTWFLIAVMALLFLAGGYSVIEYLYDKKTAPEGFTDLIKLAPLFWAPDVDTVWWGREVDELARLSGIVDEQFRRMKSKGLVGEAYAGYENITPYPIAFLRAIPDVVRATDEFLGMPTKGNANRLIRAYRLASRAYRAEAEKFARLAASAFAERPDAKLVFLGSATTPTIIRDDAALRLANADALEKEIAKRVACLRGGECDLSIKQYVVYTRPPQFVPPLPDLKKYSSALREADVRGPFFFPSRCWHNENGAPVWELLYTFRAKNAAGKKIIGAKLATENYYQRIPPRNRDVLLNAFSEKGLDFFSTVEANPYRCTDLDYWQALPTMQWLKESLSATPEISGLSDAVKRLEAAYRIAQYPSWDIALELANAYQEAMLAGNADPVIAKRHQMLRGRLVDFPATLAALNEFTAFFLKIANANDNLPISYFIQVASFSPLMFLDFSDAVWLAEEKPTRLLRDYRAPRNAELPKPGEMLTMEQSVFTLSTLRRYLTETEIVEIHRKTAAANQEINALPLE